jgi:glycosyltransferase involved in cell wall biosynthesis
MTTKLSHAHLVSIITPTNGRAPFLPLLYSAINNQTWSDIEWLVDDDSLEPSRFMQEIADRRVHYSHDPIRRSIGEKRNRLVARAKGHYIVHFDDDDYYAPQYITHMVSFLHANNADLCKLSGFFLLYKDANTFGYWDLLIKTGIHFRWANEMLEPIVLSEGNNSKLAQAHLGFGFSYVYKRSVWDSIRFPDINWNEDGEFIRAAIETKAIVLAADTQGLCLHILHGENSSRCYPQFVLPWFLIRSMFPPITPYLQQL